MKKNELRELIKEVILQEITIKKRTPAQIEAEEDLLKKIADFKQKNPDFQYASDASVKSDIRKNGALRAGIDFDKARAAYAKDKATAKKGKDDVNEIKRMQQLASIFKENLEDQYEDFTAYDEMMYESTLDVIKEMFEENGVSLDSPEYQKAEKILNDVMLGKGSYRMGRYEQRLLDLQALWNKEEAGQLGTTIAEMALGI